MMSGRFDVHDATELFTHSDEHRGWTIVIDVRRFGDHYSPEIFVRSPGSLSGTCIPHGGLYATEGAARDGGVGIGCRWVDWHGVAG